MNVTRAKDHIVSGLDDQRYCEIDDVVRELRKVAVDSEGESLLAWLKSSERDDTIEAYIPDSRKWFCRKAGRDFDYHEAVNIAVDGSGKDALDLGQLGFSPLVAISSLVISGSAQLSASYKAYPSGMLKFAGTQDLPYFTRGPQNVTAKITWGYTPPPEDVIIAQARLVAADILSMLQAADLAEAGAPGGVKQVRYDDLTITVGNEGRFANHIKRLEKRALEAALSYATPLVGSFP